MAFAIIFYTQILISERTISLLICQIIEYPTNRILKYRNLIFLRSFALENSIKHVLQLSERNSFVRCRLNHFANDVPNIII
jgi:hypothetical protein